jgi:hypothetical protein
MLCSEFFEILPRYVDVQVAGEDVDVVFADVRYHLHQCPECDEVYQALMHHAIHITEEASNVGRLRSEKAAERSLAILSAVTWLARPPFRRTIKDSSCLVQPERCGNPPLERRRRSRWIDY